MTTPAPASPTSRSSRSNAGVACSLLAGVAASGVLASFWAALTQPASGSGMYVTVALLCVGAVLAAAGLLLRRRHVLSHLAVAAIGLACLLTVFQPAFTGVVHESGLPWNGDDLD